MRLSEMKTISRLVILLYGRPLVGKTVLASQFPSPTIIELDEKLSSVMSSRSMNNEKFDLDAFFVTNDTTTDPDFIKLCGEGFAKQDAWIKTKKLTEVLLETLPQDSTLVIDSITRLSEHLMHFVEKLSNRKPLQIQDWNTFTMYLSEYRDLLRTSSAKCNVIVIGHEDVVEDKVTGAVEKILYLPTRQRYRLPAIADEYWLLRAEPKLKDGKRVSHRILQVIPDRITPCGSSQWMGNIEDPTYEKIKPYLEKGLGRKLPEPTWTPKES
ncbi:MAG: AAA family ATPase [Nanoarchaeota archaeon]|nr:AAA family ATPase [Nanoarchaeota archaeon]